MVLLGEDLEANEQLRREAGGGRVEKISEGGGQWTPVRKEGEDRASPRKEA